MTPSVTSAHEAVERRLAARALLANPILSGLHHPDQLALVRRHAPWLRQMYFSRAGYSLIIETGFARLSKAPLDADTAPRPALRTTGQPFTSRTYTCLALLCSALLAPAVGDQVLLSALVEQVRADAASADLKLSESTDEARHLVQALRLLIDWGVLHETEGTVVAWGLRADEVLLDVNRPLLPHLLARTLRDIDTPVMLLTPKLTSATQDEPRRTLRRKLIENPLVRREDLSDAERDVLSRERTELTRVLDEDFGLVLEVRAEGALAYDPDDDVTDLTFPGRSTVAHAALLLTNALIDDLSPKAGQVVTLPVATEEVSDDGFPKESPPTRPGALAPWSTVEANVELLIERYGPYFGEGYRTDASLLLNDAVRLLESMSLAEGTETGLLIHPAIARYRPEPQRLPTRAARRMGSTIDDSSSPLWIEEKP